MTATINGYHLYHSFLAGYISVLEKKAEMNRINVFPVADGDTGNNITRTIRSVLMGVSSRKSVDSMLREFAEKSLEGARGNSGMILSQFITGFYRNGKGRSSLSLQEFGDGIREAVDYAYTALEEPQEGTILTVLRVWANAVYERSLKESSFSKVMTHGLEVAKSALRKTTEQLIILRENHVVDAGALGFVSFLEGVEKFHRKGPVSWKMRRSLKHESMEITRSHRENESILSGDMTFRYCTELLLENPDVQAGDLRNSLKSYGDSLIVGEGGNRIRVHIHTDDPPGLTSYLNRLGTIVQQKVDDMVRQEQVVNSRKGSVAIVTDSIADIPLFLQDELHIHRIPLSIIWGEEEYLDRLTISPEEFYRQQQFRADFPSSSLPDLQRIDALYSYLAEHYEHILVLPVASALSGTYQQMLKGAEPYNRDETRIKVVDTRLNSAAQGLLVAEVARKAMTGASVEILSTLAENLRERVKIYVSLSTFKFMVKGGRVSPLKGFIASVLNLKPIVTLDAQGRGKAMDKAFSRQGLLKKISLLLKETQREKGIEKYCVVHALSSDKAEEFARIVQNITEKEPEFITSISPIVGMHSGKGAVAIGVIEGLQQDS